MNSTPARFSTASIRLRSARAASAAAMIAVRTVRRRAYSGAASMDFRSRCTDSRLRAARSPSGKADGRRDARPPFFLRDLAAGLGHDARRSLSSISITSRRTASVIMLASAIRSRWLRLSRSRSRVARPPRLRQIRRQRRNFSAARMSRCACRSGASPKPSTSALACSHGSHCSPRCLSSAFFALRRWPASTA